MNLRDAKREIMLNVKAGNAILLRSPSGIGKSQVVYQIYEQLKAEGAARGENWGFCTIFAATQTPPDLIGFQFKGEREFALPDGAQKRVTVTDPSVPLWMISTEGKPAFMYDKVFLLIDEYGQGEADVKRGVAEIFLNGGTAPWYLPSGSVRVACTNEGARYGVTKDFDFCIARRTVIDIIGDVDVWLSDFADKPYTYQGAQWQTMAVTKAWAKQNPTLLFEKEPEKQGPWCNPRTLCAFDRYLQVREQAVGKIDPSDPLIMEMGAGTIGMPAMQSMHQHLTFRLELPSYEKVVEDPTGTAIPNRPDLQMLMAYELAGWTQKKDLAEVVKYVQRMPKDMSVTYVTAILRRDYKGMINEPAMQGWISKNAALVSVISSLG